MSFGYTAICITSRSIGPSVPTLLPTALAPMTLVLTELSAAGIAMAADSAITMFRDGKIVEVGKRNWRKLLPVPRIAAGVSYWGLVGEVTRMQFDRWLQRVIGSSHYNDLPSFADHLADALNASCNRRPTSDSHGVGVHVAGYHVWADGRRRPMLYHVHNGHGEIQVAESLDTLGHLIEAVPTWVGEPRRLFEAHRDFPGTQYPLHAYEDALNRPAGYLTKNGDFFYYSVVWENVKRSLEYLNCIPGFSIPRDPSSISSRRGLLHTALETTIRVYRCSNRVQTIGGEVVTLAIGPNGYVP